MVVVVLESDMAVGMGDQLFSGCTMQMEMAR